MAKLFKISHENELYLIRCPGPDSYLSQIQAAACERFRLPWLQDLVFFYRDQEGDKVFVASEEDLALALESEDAPLKLKLIPRRPRTTPAPAVVVAPESSVRHAAICDGCRAPIVGVRYKCGHCADFDFCAKCLPVVPHPEDHVFLICRRAISRHVKPLLPRLENAVLRGPTTTSPLHPCPLQLTLPYNGHYICNGCGMPGRGPAHHCAEHQFDLHPRCARPNLATTGVVPLPLPLPTTASSAVAPVRPPAATSVRPPAATSACAPVRPATPPTGMRPVPADNFGWVPSSAPASSACRPPVVRVNIAKKPEAESVAPVLPDLAKKPGAESVAPVLDLTSLVEPQPAGRLMKLSVPELAPAEPVVAAPAAPTTPASIDPVPSAPAAEPGPYEAELKTLLAMGFDRQVAEVVLNLRNGDIALCLSDLLGQ